MAKKTKSLREPPTVSSSNSSEEEQHHNHEEEEDEDSSEKDQPVSNNPPPPSSTSHPNTESDDSGSESESDPPPPPPSTISKVKPLQSKPKGQTPKANPKKDRSTSKRSAKNNESGNDSKRAKRKVTLAIPAVALSSEDKDDANQKPKPKPVNDARKLFQRLWSDEDEIAILKGMAEFTSNTGNDPSKNADAFYDFVKKSLHVEASINQLKEKIRRLKKKYQNNACKKKPPTFSKPHDREAFALSQKVWGDVEEEAVEIPTQEDRAVEVARPRPKHEVKSKDSKKAVVTDPDEKDDTTSYLTGMILMDKGFGSYGMNEDLVKRGMDLIEESQREELEGQWREVQDAELGLAVQRAELVAHQARLILEAFKSSTD